MCEEPFDLIDLKGRPLLAVPFAVDQSEVAQELYLPDRALLGTAVLRNRLELCDMPIDRCRAEPDFLGLPGNPHSLPTLKEFRDR